MSKPASTKNFLLPDLGEGLPDATIVEWYVKVGDTIRLDDNLVSMETAKAVVDVPSPVSGRILKLAGAAGDIIVTGTMLAEFEVDPNLPQRAEGQDTGHHHGPSHDTPKPAAAPAPAKASEDAGTVVGAMQVGDAVVAQAAIAVGGVKAMPAPWSARCRSAMRWSRKSRLPSAASRQCRPCARWRASSASTSRACARAVQTAW